MPNSSYPNLKMDICPVAGKGRLIRLLLNDFCKSNTIHNGIYLPSGYQTSLKGIQVEFVCICFSMTCVLAVIIQHWKEKSKSQYHLTPSLRRPCIHAIYFSTECRTACKHAFCFLRVMPEAVSTRHSWLWQTLDDVYTRRCFSESEGTRFGAPGQKALPSGNEWMEWNEWMDFCLIPLSTTCSVEVPGTNL